MAAAPRPTSRPARRPAPRRRRSTGRRVLLVLLALLLGGAVLGGAAFAYGYATTDVPEPTELGQKATTTVYYADGTTVLGTFADVNRTPVTTDAIPQDMRDAIIAAEDRSFYENRGVSPTGIARAFVSNLRGNATQGGSTITQQYVKNYYTGDDTQSLQRKVREAFIALKVDNELDKDQILTDYLNTIYFGRGAYGVQEAAQAYFGVDVGQLTTAQAALLAGIVPAPSAYDPAVDPEAAERRWEYVVDGMVETGAVTQAERDGLELPETVQQQDEQTYAGPTGHLLQAVRDELTTRGGFTEDELDGGGLSITTTFDAGMQAAAVAAMQDPEAFPSEGRPEDVAAALVSIDPADGSVRAMYGGPDYLQRQLNMATQENVQAGSIFKPFTLVAALEDGISLRTRFPGYSPQYFDEYRDGKGERVRVGNFGGESHGRQSLVEATVDSTNTIFVPLNIEVGAEATADVAERAGLPADTEELEPPVLSNVLGTPSPKVVDMARAYATFAAQGVRTTPHVVSAVTQDGEEVFRAQTGGERVFDEAVMADTTYALSQVVEEGSVRRTIDLGRPAAGKTGTTDEARSAWFAGYTPQLATVVSVFTTKPGSEGGMEPWSDDVSSVTGSSYPTRIWQAYMATATAGMPVVDFPERADIGSTSTSRSRSSSSERERDSSSGSSSRPAPAPAPAPEPTSEPSAAPTTAAPEPTQAPAPTATTPAEPEPAPEPTQQPEAPRPTATRPPAPQEPSPPPVTPSTGEAGAAGEVARPGDGPQTPPAPGPGSDASRADG
ncbi:transglycosylase domain-containing protein [uncultured Pseudokineococcus sp.]|uniref:transglycosylase domain-containing protein n=1 Tax=uncultured Pseudokineococcus sp. TaxID=1642928 RepID=UPI00263900E0|nr:transglycosylase domain-containing protein [uncultured Pseudokineococcus sp.]